MPANGLNVTNSYEYVICFGIWLKSNKTYTKNTLTTSVANMHKEHRAVMNQDVSDFFIENFTQKGDTILDCFGGLGTTAISALKYKRNYILIEKEAKYVEIARNRIQQFANSQTNSLFNL